MSYLDLGSYSIQLPTPRGLERVADRPDRNHCVVVFQARRRPEEAHVWPSLSVGAQQSSLLSYGTVWDLRAAPCSSEATVTISPHNRERDLAEGRKRSFPGAWLTVRADQVRTKTTLSHTYWLTLSLQALKSNEALASAQAVGDSRCVPRLQKSRHFVHPTTLLERQAIRKKRSTSLHSLSIQ